MTFTDLSALPFVDFPPGWPNRVHADELFAQAGVGRDVGIEVADTVAALDLVRGGLGVAFLPRRSSRDASLTRVLVLARPSTPQRPAVEAVHQALLASSDYP